MLTVQRCLSTTGVMIHKIDCCMLDLLAFHEKAAEEESEQNLNKPWSAAANIIARAASFGSRPVELSVGGSPEKKQLDRKPSIKSHP